MLKRKIVIETPRLILFEPGRDDVPAILEYLEQATDYHERWSPIRDKDFCTPPFQAALLRSVDDTKVRLEIVEKDVPGAIIGEITFSQIHMGAFCSCFAGYGILEEMAGKGYMTEALKFAIQYMFRERGLHRIEANVMPSNPASMKVLQKLGFSNDGLRRKYLKIYGKWEDHYSFSRINEEMD